LRREGRAGRLAIGDVTGADEHRAIEGIAARWSGDT